ncbi:MAG TPA: hypothetical protein VFC80_06825 [Sphaerochaeta sp.]|nr:hypothetical protein [Sphaerochaeta sp.]
MKDFDDSSGLTYYFIGYNVDIGHDYFGTYKRTDADTKDEYATAMDILNTGVWRWSVYEATSDYTGFSDYEIEMAKQLSQGLDIISSPHLKRQMVNYTVEVKRDEIAAVSVTLITR